MKLCEITILTPEEKIETKTQGKLAATQLGFIIYFMYV
jgi:hypothetical protein